MPRYRKRPIEVTADQWFPGISIPGLNVDYRNNEATVVTIQGVVTPVTPGEWVIQEGDGVHAYPCDPTVFARIYKPCPVVHSEGGAMTDDPRLWAAIRKAVEVKLLPSHCSQDDYLAHIDMIRQVLAAADEAVLCPESRIPAPASTAKEDRCETC